MEFCTFTLLHFCSGIFDQQELKSSALSCYSLSSELFGILLSILLQESTYREDMPSWC